MAETLRERFLDERAPYAAVAVLEGVDTLEVEVRDAARVSTGRGCLRGARCG